MGASLVALLMLCIGAAGVSAAECSVEVAPAAGQAGTVFVFSGSGFSPTQLNLHKDDSAAGSHRVDVSDEDPWEVEVRSRPGDEGVWSAELSSDDCSATAQFRVTLSNTDAADDAVAGSTLASPPLIAMIALLAAGATGGLVLGRRLQPAAIDNRPL